MGGQVSAPGLGDETSSWSWKRKVEDEMSRVEDGGLDSEVGRTEHLGCKRVKRDVKDVPAGCRTPPKVKHISQEWQRSEEGIIGSCDAGYESPFGGQQLLIVCIDGEWEKLPWPDPSDPSCVPVCPLGCGAGRCLAPNTCECPYGLNGTSCEVALECSEPPLIPRYSKFVMGRPGNGKLACEEGYNFLSNTSELSLVCIDGLWFAPEVEQGEEKEIVSGGRIKGDGIMCRKKLEEDCTSGDTHVLSGHFCNCPEGYFGSQCKVKCAPLRQVSHAFHFRSEIASTSLTLELRCWPGYSISMTNLTKITIHCEGGVWKTPKELNVDYNKVSCELSCADEEKGIDGCQNGGTCVEDRVCVCPKNFEGQFCEIRRCSHEGLPPLNDAYYFFSDKVTPEGNPLLKIKCREGFFFPNDSSVIYVKCRDGQWDFDVEEFQRCLPRCNVICEPPLRCVGPDRCACDNDTRSAKTCKDTMAQSHVPPLPKIVNGKIEQKPNGKYYVKCRTGYQINNQTTLEMMCFNQTWLIVGVHPGYYYECKPQCIPPCIPREECVAPNKCQCYPQFQGENCEFFVPTVPVCPSTYPYIPYANVSDDGLVLCLSGYQLSDNLNLTQLICVEGHFTVDEGDGVCYPVCEPGCYNGGTCVEPHICLCPEGFSGSRCQVTSCPDRLPELFFATILQCTDEGPLLICQMGYKFPSGESQVPLFCDKGVWTVSGKPKLPLCSPVCEPKCQNGGECVAPNKCYCPFEFGGPTCDQPKCSSLPNGLVNAKFLNKVETGIAFCTDGYTFNSRSGAEDNITCIDGKWDIWIKGERRNELVKIKPENIGEMVLFQLGCLPLCNPPCLNGGTCVAHNLCMCPSIEIGSSCHAHTCPCPLPIILNANYLYGDSKAIVRCKPGFKLSFGGDMITMSCLATEWVVHQYESFEPPTCIPVCEQVCLHGGVCQEDGTCACPPGYAGVSCELDVDGLCYEPPPTLNNTMLILNNNTGTYTCLPEFRLANSTEVTVLVECRNSSWVFPEYDNSSMLPECVFWCEKGGCGLTGTCLPTGKCQCSNYWTGERCDEVVHGISCPKLNLENTKIVSSNNTVQDGQNVTVTCLDGYEMSNGMTSLNMQCVEGIWLSSDPTHYDDAIGCLPVCHPPCLNGGKCKRPDHCVCKEFFKGADCGQLAYGKCWTVFDGPANLTVTERNGSLVLRCESERPVGEGEVEMLLSCSCNKWMTPLDWSWNVTCTASEECRTPDAPQNAFITQNFSGTYLECDAGFSIEKGKKIVRLECIPEKNVWVLVDTGPFFAEDVACTLDESEVCDMPCGAHGVCVRYRCVCHPGWTGPFCRTQLCTSTDFLVENAEGISFIKSGERVVVFCSAGYRLPSGTTSVMAICHKGSWMLTGSLYGFERIRCKPSCHPPCQNLGICMGDNICACQFGFTGDTCEICGEEGPMYVTTSGLPCDRMPFHFKGVLQHHCYQADPNSPAWCPTRMNVWAEEVIEAGLCLLDWGHKKVKLTYSGESCTFPFFYEGSLHYSCITRNGFSFCAIGTDIENRPLRYKECAADKDIPVILRDADLAIEGELKVTTEGRVCQFPFVYEGKTYYECVQSNTQEVWCATKVDVNRVGQRFGICTTKRYYEGGVTMYKLNITQRCLNK